MDGDYILMNDLDEDTDGYDEYNIEPEDYEVREYAGAGENWEDGNTIDISFDEEVYESISVEDDDGNLISHTVDHPRIIIDEDTGESYLYVTYENAGVGWNPIGDFHGTFDGNGYEINDLFINRPGTSGVGFFGYTGSEAKVINVGIVDAEVNGSEHVGALAGISGGNISESYARGDVSGIVDVGVLLGVSNGNVSNSYARGKVSGDIVVGGLVGGSGDGVIESSFAKVNVSGEDILGGLIGVNGWYSTVKNSYSLGDVSGGNWTGRYHIGPGCGGLVGFNWNGTIQNSYAAGNVSGYEDTGGLVGNHSRGINVYSSYWGTEISGQDTSDGGIGLYTDDMRGEVAETNMEGFDFEEIWETVKEGDEDLEEDGYPILQELSREEQLKAQDVYVEDDDDIPGFTSLTLVLGVIIAVAIYRKKKNIGDKRTIVK